MGMKEFIGVEQITENNGNIIWRAAFAEFLGNMILNLFGCGCIMLSVSQTPDHVLIALTFGLAIYLIVQTLGHVSGGHFNPAVSCGMLVTGNIGLLKFLIYVVAQCVGAIVGTAILLALAPEGYEGNFGNTQIGENITLWQGFIFEFILGFILIFVVMGFCDQDRPETNPTGSLSVGLAVGIGHLAFINATGSSMNPARSLGSALIAKQWDNHWVYWIGPIGGGVAAALLYRWVFAKADFGYQGVPTKDLQRLDKQQAA